MRLWTIHPQYLDTKGLVALWREGLLAQKVLQGGTRGYRHHPQLLRFQAQARPVATLARFLEVVLAESRRRGYSFDGTKISRPRFQGHLKETEGQVAYEWRHLLRKLQVRDPERHKQYQHIATPVLHPLFRLVQGGVRDWEHVQR
jgi:hypothetical protein